MESVTEALKDLVVELKGWREAARERDLRLEEAIAAMLDESESLRDSVRESPWEHAVERLEVVCGRLEDAVRSLSDCVDRLGSVQAEKREECAPMDPTEYMVVQELYGGPAGEAIKGLPLGRQVDLLEQVVRMVKSGGSGTSGEA